MGRHANPLRSSRRGFVRTFALVLATQPAIVWADVVYQAPEEFVAQFVGAGVAPAYVWLTPDLRAAVAEVLGHPCRQARVRYWRSGDTTAWILDEIGKEYPITAGFVVRGGEIVAARVLVYRESRGQEIHQPRFLAQFDGARLDAERRLTREIHSISGATMSVDAMDRMARTALLLAARLPP